MFVSESRDITDFLFLEYAPYIVVTRIKENCYLEEVMFSCASPSGWFESILPLVSIATSVTSGSSYLPSSGSSSSSAPPSGGLSPGG